MSINYKRQTTSLRIEVADISAYRFILNHEMAHLQVFSAPRWATGITTLWWFEAATTISSFR
jgi:hypothetical protein